MANDEGSRSKMNSPDQSHFESLFIRSVCKNIPCPTYHKPIQFLCPHLIQRQSRKELFRSEVSIRTYPESAIRGSVCEDFWINEGPRWDLDARKIEEEARGSLERSFGSWVENITPPKFVSDSATKRLMRDILRAFLFQIPTTGQPTPMQSCAARWDDFGMKKWDLWILTTRNWPTSRVTKMYFSLKPMPKCAIKDLLAVSCYHCQFAWEQLHM